MFHPSPSIILLISILYKHLWPTITLLVIYALLISHSYARQPDWVLSGTFINAENAHAMFVDNNGDELLLELGDDIQGCDLVDVLQGSAKLNCSGGIYILHLRSSVGDISDGLVQRNPETGGPRLAFTFDPGEAELVEFRAQLRLNGAPFSEVWLYRWTRG